ncbi:unnamed protein product, partial [Rotaria sp. Silwood2]
LPLRAQFEQRIIRRIRHLLHQRPDIVLCRADQTKVLYCGHRETMVAKAHDNMNRTKSYQHLSNGRCPLADIVHAVHTLLNSLVQQKGLTNDQANRLRPIENKLELSLYHDLPKTHT